LSSALLQGLHRGFLSLEILTLRELVSAFYPKKEGSFLLVISLQREFALRLGFSEALTENQKNSWLKTFQQYGLLIKDGHQIRGR
jgi:hypothetical protein